MVLYSLQYNYTCPTVCYSDLYYRQQKDFSQNGRKQEKAKDAIKMAGADATDAGAAEENERIATKEQTLGDRNLIALRHRRVGFAKDQMPE